MARQFFSRGKRPYERFPIEWDFVTELAQIAGDAISAFTVTVRSADGVDQTVAFLDTTVLLGSVVQAWIKDGNTSVDYIVTFRVVTAAGAKWENDVLVSVSGTA